MKIAVAIVALIALVGGGALFYSDVWRTKVGSQIKQFAEWTPENIAKYPDDYLDFCDAQIQHAQGELKARKVAMEQAKAQITATREDAADKAQTGDTVLAKLKDLYKATAKANAWPVMYEGRSVDEEWMRDEILQVNVQTQGKHKIVANSDANLAKLKATERRIPGIEAQAQQQLSDIQAGRQTLKVDHLTHDLDTQLVNMKGAIQGVVTDTDSTPAHFDLDSATPNHTDATADSNFQSVLNK